MNKEFNVHKSMKEYKLKCANDVEKENLTFLDKISYKVCDFFGSWLFLIVLCIFMIIWVILNTYILISKPDPYPFILLNLALSFLAAIQNPVILKAESLSAKRDRIKSEEDYKTNLQSNMIIQHLHTTIDSMDKRMENQQQLTIELLQEIKQLKSDKDAK